jgi:hypothetical protein
MLVLALAATCVLLTGCSGHGSAPIGKVDDSPATVVNFPSGYPNVAFKCLGPNGIYSGERRGGVSVVANDANCVESS